MTRRALMTMDRVRLKVPTASGLQGEGVVVDGHEDPFDPEASWVLVALYDHPDRPVRALWSEVDLTGGAHD